MNIFLLYNYRVDDLVVTTKLIKGAYDVSAYKVIEDANLSSLASTYECELTIPNTNYVRRQTKLYEPGKLFSSYI